MHLRNRILFGVLLSGLFAGTLQAQAGARVDNWTVPEYRGQSGSGGLSVMTDISPGTTFVAMTPCRVFDTRGAVGAYGGPRLVANAPRSFDVDSGPCGPIPSGVEAYSMSFGAIQADGDGFITIWPTGQAQPLVSTMNPLQGAVTANAAIVPKGTNGAISVFPNSGVHLIGDINGYFTNTFNDGNLLVQVGTNVGGGIGTFINFANTNNSTGIYGIVGPGFTDNQCCAPTGVIGKGAFAGVAGSSQDRGTVGILVNVAGNLVAEGQLGKVGGAGQAFGVRGFVNANANGNGTAAVLGETATTSGFNFGVKGISGSAALDSAGVKGVSGYGDPLGDTTDCGPCFSAGVRGVSDSAGLGVIGIARAGTAVVGAKLNPSDNGLLNAGYLGTTLGYAVYAQGGYGGTGAKYFIEPHATDPSLVVKYIALEGPESGTYFRGKGKFQNGIAIVDEPEDFRMVTDIYCLSIHEKTIGQMSTVAVQEICLERIFERGSRNV